jgi:hypothetical protein
MNPPSLRGVRIANLTRANILQLQDFILDIDGIQAHGIGAADITKLKANGFYTIAVSALTLTTLSSRVQAHAIPQQT